MLGGITGPIVAAAATREAEKFGLKPLSTIALCRTCPSPAASAIADPDIPEKITLAITHTWPSPPGIWPTTALAKRKIRLVTPPVFIRFAARIKKGIASSVKPVVEAYIRCGNMVSSDPLPRPMKNRIAVKHIATAMGMFKTMNARRTAKIDRVSMCCLSDRFECLVSFQKKV